MLQIPLFWRGLGCYLTCIVRYFAKVLINIKCFFLLLFRPQSNPSVSNLDLYLSISSYIYHIITADTPQIYLPGIPLII